MGLEVYYPQDIRNALLAAEQASRTALLAAGGGEDNEFARGYREGYGAALVTMALAFGLMEPYVCSGDHQRKQMLVNERATLVTKLDGVDHA